MTTASLTDSAQVARWFHALSDPTRVEIARRLSCGERCVCELTSDLGAAQSRLSFHLKTLKTAGVVVDRREGRWVYYALNPDVLASIAGFLGELSAGEEWVPDHAACG